MKKIILTAIALVLMMQGYSQQPIMITKDRVQGKIKGVWAGQKTYRHYRVLNPEGHYRPSSEEYIVFSGKPVVNKND